jgi:predicted ATPase/DNA-binding SARP family transcriptional activator
MRRRGKYLDRWCNMDSHQTLANAATPAGSCLVIRLLGGFGVTRAGTAVAGPWRGEKARALVKLLALAPDHVLHRDQILDHLWPELEPAAAANNLYFTLHVARRALAGAAGDVAAPDLVLRDGLLRLAPPGGLTTDVAAFEAAALSARDSDDPPRCEAALALYTGELLPEDRYAEWTIGRREALRETYLGLLSRLADLRARRGEWGAVIAALERIISEDAVRETAHAGLMRALAATGQRGRALRQYADLRAIMRSELDAEPDASTQALYAAILAGRLPGIVTTAPEAAAPPACGNLPALLTRFIGRAPQIATLRSLLDAASAADAGARLVTLTGSGGCGKTRLALEVARGLVEDYRDGVWLVELAALADPGLAPGTVAQVLGVREAPGQPIAETLVTTLRERTLLIVLDNCEHLLDTCAQLATRLLTTCPQVRILATSREALQIPGEVVWRVPSLSLPPEPTQLPPGAAGRDRLLASEAAQLLVARIGLHHPGFALAPGDDAVVAAICRQLDGIPLALELAAARAAHLALGDVAARLDDMLGLLTTGGRAVLPRHQTLRAVLEWSTSLLDGEERVLLGRLAVFAGGGTLAAIEAVCGDAPGASDDGRTSVVAGNTLLRAATLDVLARLVDKSLVHIDEEGGELRYRLLEMTRQFAGQLLATREGESLRDRHLAYYLALAEEAEPLLRGAHQARWFGMLDRELDNLRGALRWALDRPAAESALRLAGALGRFWTIRWKIAEGGAWLGRALALAGTRHYPAAHAKALLGLGELSWRFGDPARAEDCLGEGLRLAQSLGLAALENHALRYLALMRIERDQPAAERYALAASVVARAAHDLPSLCAALNTLGEVTRVSGDYPRAIHQYEEALTIARQIGEQSVAALALFNLSFVRLKLGDAAGARVALVESTHLNLALGKRGIEGPTLDAVAALACTGDQPQLAVRFFGAAQSWLVAASRARRDPADQAEYDQYTEQARAALGAAAYAAAWAAGHALPLADSFAEALAYLGC